MKFVHISDLHLTAKSIERHGRVLDALVSDIEKAVGGEDAYIVFSGDVVQAGSSKASYDEVERLLLRPLETVGWGRDRLILTPGNHDVDASYVKENIVPLVGLQGAAVAEVAANDLLRGMTASMFSGRLSEYSRFEAGNALYGVGPSLLGQGHVLPGQTGVFISNTSIASFGGNPRPDARTDEGQLWADTRNVSDWLGQTSCDFRILVMHHPIEWMKDFNRAEYADLIQSKFDLYLHGHLHEQRLSLAYGPMGGCIRSVSPPLLTEKDRALGYSIIEIGDERVQLTYRHWSKANSCFVPGANFTGNEHGIVSFPRRQIAPPAAAFHSPQRAPSRVVEYLEQAFRSSATHATREDSLWVDPDLSITPEASDDREKAVNIGGEAIAGLTGDLILKAPPQYGLSALAHYVAMKRAQQGLSRLPLVFKSDDAPNYEAGLVKFTKDQTRLRYGQEGVPDFVAIDNFDPSADRAVKQLRSLKKAFPNVSVIVLITIDDVQKIEQRDAARIGLTCPEYHLWTFSRAKIRELVRQFLGDSPALEDQTVERLADHLDNLNLPRTAHNCLTLLTIFEAQADASPVNRTEIIELFLQVLFASMRGIPKYNDVPDLKDSLYALGALSELLIKEDRFSFTKKEFYDLLNAYCREQLVTLEIDALFLVLCNANIILKRDTVFVFRYAYWLFFFAAHRMHHSSSFYDYIMDRRRYAAYPELIEFYSGIDRRSTDLLRSLLTDLKALNSKFADKVAIPDSFDPFQVFKWTPSQEGLQDALEAIADAASESNLPTSMKDAIADGNYDRSKPYRQEINTLVDESSMRACVNVMRCSARALRNSDHADVRSRRELLQEIALTWSRHARLIMMLAPILAEEGAGEIEGLRFYLGEEFSEYDRDTKLLKILGNVPFNVLNYFSGDLFSAKNGPLYAEYIDVCEDALMKHLIALQVIRGRPKGWSSVIHKYMAALPKNSYYLADMSKTAEVELNVGFHAGDDSRALRQLVGQALARHYKGAKNPSRELTEKLAKLALDSPEKGEAD